MTAVTRTRHLAALQDSLTARAAEPSSRQPMLLPFVVGSHSLALPYADVARVTLPSSMVRLPPAPQVPAFVVGVAASEGDLLTVVDAGRLLGSHPVEQTIKTRLIVMGHGPMKGFGLLVTRACDLAAVDTVREDPSTQITSAADLIAQIDAWRPATAQEST